MSRKLKIILFTSVILVLFYLIILSVKYSPVYVFRLVTMNVADVYDYQIL